MQHNGEVESKIPAQPNQKNTESIASQVVDYPHIFVREILTLREGVTGKNFYSPYIKKLKGRIEAALAECDPLLQKYLKSKQDPNLALQLLDKVIEVHTAARVGNCGVLAVFALYYVLDNAPEMKAEVFHIEDKVTHERTHSFVVIGRKNESNPKDPTSWGEEAYICDPWSRKSYPATEYLTKLHSFSYEAKSQTFFTEKFTSDRFVLASDEFQNTDNLRPTIKGNFLNKFQNYEKRIENLITSLKRIYKPLEESKKENTKKKILSDKLSQANKLLANIKNVIDLLNKDKLGYTTLKEHDKNFKMEINILELSQTDKQSFKLCGLFKTATYKDVDNVFKQLKQDLNSEKRNSLK